MQAITRKTLRSVVAVVVVGGWCLAGGVALAPAYAHGNGHQSNAAHGHGHGNSGNHGNSRNAGTTMSTSTNTTKNTTTNGTSSGTSGTTANTWGNASQMCSQNNNQVFGAGIKISHGACVSTLKSNGHSSALYASLCRYLVANPTVTPSSLTPGSFLPAGTSASITKVIGALTNTGPYKNVGQCVKAFNQAKHTVLSKH